MTSETLTGAGLSLATAAVWGGGDFAGGIATRRANVFKVVAGAHACGLLLMLLLVWITGEALPPRSTLLWGAAAGIAGALGVAALYRGFAIGRMGIVAPVSAVITGVLPVLAGIYSEGMPAPIQLVGLCSGVGQHMADRAPRRQNRHSSRSGAGGAGGRDVRPVLHRL